CTDTEFFFRHSVHRHGILFSSFRAPTRNSFFVIPSPFVIPCTDTEFFFRHSVHRHGIPLPKLGKPFIRCRDAACRIFLIKG
ncbi:hypothetical protein COY07_02835, partial [Candidatus Peregrinibacteria bacterium CG_4_10_14_0_2_um_filter_43_11]